MKSDNKYRNMVDDPYLLSFAKGEANRNFCGCGFAANGEDMPAEQEPELETGSDINQKVVNMQAWNYFRTALVLVGAYVVIKFLYDKYKSK